MKKIRTVAAALLLAAVLSACGSPGAAGEPEGETLQIVATIFPEYDWVLEILGDNPAGAEVTLLLDSGVDLHSYQPTAGDILKLSACDLFVYVGGESDAWAQDALQEASNPDMTVLNLLEILGEGAKEEELVEGMEAEADGDEEDGEDAEYDEHVWLSLKNASVFCAAITDALSALDSENASVYQSNLAAYREQLEALDGEYQDAVGQAASDTLLFADRFPFRYLVEDYGLRYYAAFSGCSAETEASFETVAFLAQKLDELSLTYVLTLEGSDQKIAETVVQNTQTKDQRILAMDSMQSATLADAESGVSYLSVMRSNLQVLREALG